MGFQTLRDLLPDTIGDCVSNQTTLINGDAQQVTAKGLLVWRAADNSTAFSDGYHTWVNGPLGVQERLNTERFPWEASPRLDQLQADFLSKLNGDRQANGLAPLALSDQLMRLAAARAQDELKLGVLNHYDAAGNLVLRDIVDTNHIPYASAGENLAENNYGQPRTVDEANSGLMHSPAHRANILDANYNQVGVGLAGPDAEGRYFYVQLFVQTP